MHFYTFCIMRGSCDLMAAILNVIFFMKTEQTIFILNLQKKVVLSLDILEETC
jgi:hypothetical protein